MKSVDNLTVEGIIFSRNSNDAELIRTKPKSLVDLKQMPPFGELIVEPESMVNVKWRKETIDSAHLDYLFTYIYVRNFVRFYEPGTFSLQSSPTRATKQTRDHLYKILVIGDLGAGKTSIIKRYVHQFFSQHYRATIGVDFALKVINWDDSTVIRLQLWDIAGE